jgi:hypothetical protein
MEQQIFPKWTNKIRNLLGAGAGALGVYALIFFSYGASPKTINVGYQPDQPVPFSHALHAGELGLDCRYCHNTVEKAALAAVPPTETCMNCHARIRTKSPKLALVRESFMTGKGIPWVKVHDLPDYVKFNHSAHVTRGVSCVSCHGRVDQMEKVRQVEPLSMGWCLQCHRNPEAVLRPKNKVTDLAWKPKESQETLGARLRKEYNINPPTSCSTCHQ